MSAAASSCTNCGATLPVSPEAGAVYCPYCGAAATAEPRPNDVVRVWRGELNLFLIFILVGFLSILVYAVGAVPLVGILFLAAADPGYAVLAAGTWMLPTIIIVAIWYRRLRQRLVERGAGKGLIALLRDRRLIVRVNDRQQVFDLRYPLAYGRYWCAYRTDNEVDVTGALLWLQQGASTALIKSFGTNNTCGMSERDDAVRLSEYDLQQLGAPTEIELHRDALREVDALLSSPPATGAT